MEMPSNTNIKPASIDLYEAKIKVNVNSNVATNHKKLEESGTGNTEKK